MAREEVARRNGTGCAVVLSSDSAINHANHPGGLIGRGGRAGARGGSGGDGDATIGINTASWNDGGMETPEHTYQTSKICVVCLDAEADHVVVPCGHVCLCGHCADKVMRRRGGPCPVGRCVVGNICLVEIGDGGGGGGGGNAGGDKKKGGGRDGGGGAAGMEDEKEDRDGADEEGGRSRGKGEDISPPRMISEDEVDDDASASAGASASGTMVC